MGLNEYLVIILFQWLSFLFPILESIIDCFDFPKYFLLTPLNFGRAALSSLHSFHKLLQDLHFQLFCVIMFLVFSSPSKFLAYLKWVKVFEAFSEHAYLLKVRSEFFRFL